MNNKDLMLRLVADTKKWEEGMKNAKRSLDDMKNGTDAAMDTMKSKIMGFVSVTALIGTAMKVVKDTMARSETAMDAWGEAVEVGRASYNTFLDSLNGGDWSNFFSNIGRAISDAKELYAALDRMDSVTENNRAAILGVRSKIQSLRLEKQTATDPSRVAQINEEMRVASQELQRLMKDGVTATLEAAREKAANTLTSKYNATKGVGTLDKEDAVRVAQALAERGQIVFDEYQKIIDDIEKSGKGIGDIYTTVPGSGLWGNPNVITSKGFSADYLSPEDRQAYLFAKTVVDSENPLREAAEMFRQAKEEELNLNREMVRITRYILQKGQSEGKGVKGLPSILSDRTAGTSVGSIGSEVLISRMRPTEEAMEHFTKWFEENPPAPIEIPIAASIKDMKDTASGIAEAFNAASGALGNFANESRQAAIAAKAFTIAGAIAQLVGQFASIPKGKEIWSWIAGTIAGTGTLIATIASIKSATSSYSEGGKIRGNHSVGDMIPVFANAGEIVMNASMQRNVASQLTAGNGIGQIELRLTGDELVGCVNNYGRSRGMGKLTFGG